MTNALHFTTFVQPLEGKEIRSIIYTRAKPTTVSEQCVDRGNRASIITCRAVEVGIRPSGKKCRREGLGGPVDLAIDTSQKEFNQPRGGQVSTVVRFSVNHIPNRMFLLELVVKRLKENSCILVRTYLDKLDTKLRESCTRFI